MSERDLDEERRLRRAAVARHGALPEAQRGTPYDDPYDDTGLADADVRPQADDEEDDGLAARRMDQKGMWVEFQIRKAMERGEFDNLPGAGKPLNLPDRHDPDWWVKRLIEREKISGVAPPAIGLRREDAELEATIDREVREEGVRRVVDEFNRRVVEARRQLQGGPPVVTPLRDADAEVAAWRERRSAAARAGREAARVRERERRAEAEAARRARPSLLRRAVRTLGPRRGA
jgi:hypothetical protein